MSLAGTPFPVAILGVGNMGGAMAERLLALGWPVHVRDLVEERMAALAALGATAHRSAAEAAAAADVVIVCVVDATQCRQVLFDEGAARAQALGGSVVLCPTLGPAEVENIAVQLHAQGLHALDAPISGGPARAREGRISMMVACSPPGWLRCHGLLAALSNSVFRIGERPGDGARTKLVNNLAAAINLAGAAEVLALAERLGLDAATTLQVMEQSSGQSWIGSDRMRRALAGDLAPRAHLALLEKDTRLALEAADAAGFRGPLGAPVRDLFAAAAEGGQRAQDDAVLLDWLRRHA